MLAQSRREATTDALTGLGNRRQLKGDLPCISSTRSRAPLMLTLFDLDGFKEYNDTFGTWRAIGCWNGSAGGSPS